MPSNEPSELDIFVNILEQQRNNALSELARAAARIAILERALISNAPEEKKE